MTTDFRHHTRKLGEMLLALAEAERDAFIYGTGFVRITKQRNGEFRAERVDSRSVQLLARKNEK